MLRTQERRLQSTKLLNSEERFKLPRGELRIARLPKKKEKTIRKKLDLPQVDCERASENEGRSRATRAKVARRVDLFRLRNIEFNLHIVGAKKPQEQSTGCTGLSYSKSTS